MSDQGYIDFPSNPTHNQKYPDLLAVPPDASLDNKKVYVYDSVKGAWYVDCEGGSGGGSGGGGSDEFLSKYGDTVNAGRDVRYEYEHSVIVDSDLVFNSDIFTVVNDDTDCLIVNSGQLRTDAPFIANNTVDLGTSTNPFLATADQHAVSKKYLEDQAFVRHVGDTMSGSLSFDGSVNDVIEFNPKGNERQTISINKPADLAENDSYGLDIKIKGNSDFNTLKILGTEGVNDVEFLSVGGNNGEFTFKTNVTIDSTPQSVVNPLKLTVRGSGSLIRAIDGAELQSNVLKSVGESNLSIKRHSTTKLLIGATRSTFYTPVKYNNINDLVWGEAGDLVYKKYVDDALVDLNVESKVAIAGDTMTGSLNMGGNTLDSIGGGTINDGAAFKSSLSGQDIFVVDVPNRDINTFALTNPDHEIYVFQPIKTVSGFLIRDEYKRGTAGDYLFRVQADREITEGSLSDAQGGLRTSFGVLGNGVIVLGSDENDPFIPTRNHHAVSKYFVDHNFVNKTGGDSMQGPLNITGDRTPNDAGLESTLKVLNVDSGGNSSLNLKQRGATKVYVGADVLTCQTDIKINVSGRQLLSSDNKPLFTFNDAGVFYEGAYTSNKHIVTKEKLDEAIAGIDVGSGGGDVDLSDIESSIQELDNNKVDKNGDVMTGPLKIDMGGSTIAFSIQGPDPDKAALDIWTSGGIATTYTTFKDNEYVTKKYVDDNIVAKTDEKVALAGDVMTGNLELPQLIVSGDDPLIKLNDQLLTVSAASGPVGPLGPIQSPDLATDFPNGDFELRETVEHKGYRKIPFMIDNYLYNLDERSKVGRLEGPFGGYEEQRTYEDLKDTGKFPIKSIEYNDFKLTNVTYGFDGELMHVLFAPSAMMDYESIMISYNPETVHTEGWTSQATKLWGGNMGAVWDKKNNKFVAMMQKVYNNSYDTRIVHIDPYNFDYTILQRGFEPGFGNLGGSDGRGQAYDCNGKIWFATRNEVVCSSDVFETFERIEYMERMKSTLNLNLTTKAWAFYQGKFHALVKDSNSNTMFIMIFEDVLDTENTNIEVITFNEGGTKDASAPMFRICGEYLVLDDSRFFAIFDGDNLIFPDVHDPENYLSRMIMGAYALENGDHTELFFPSSYGYNDFYIPMIPESMIPAEPWKSLDELESSGGASALKFNDKRVLTEDDKDQLISTLQTMVDHLQNQVFSITGRLDSIEGY